MKRVYDADGNADLEEAAFAEKDISVILESVDFSSAPRDVADAVLYLLGRCARELADATWRTPMREAASLRGRVILTVRVYCMSCKSVPTPPPQGRGDLRTSVPFPTSDALGISTEYPILTPVASAQRTRK